ncbi:ribosome silencing factor [Hoeflea sp.]|uniref:ribosome silencing factor n=1 Tax=Hoeflea sp. TaxID=1940281 RepID=UPI003B01BBEF
MGPAGLRAVAGTQLVLSQKGKTLRTAHSKGNVEHISSSALESGNAAFHALKLVLASLEESKAEDVVSIDITGKSALGDHMVVSSGRSNRHVTAICDHLLRDLKDAGFGTAKVEGLSNGDWVLIDAGDIIIHVFRPEVREFYNIEKMWMTPEIDEDTLH